MQKQAIQSTKNSNPPLLAHWRFTNEQWREFIYYEKLDCEHRTFVDLRTILTFGIGGLGIISIIAATKGGLPAFLIVLALGVLFFGFCFGIHRLVRMDTKRKLNTMTGEVQITSRNVNVNGAVFDWRGNWSLPYIQKDYIYIGEKKMLLLNFTCNGWVYVKGGREPIEKKWLVPVEPGKESEADAVIKELTETWSQKFPLSSEESK